jgi:hypothetical protein
LFDFLDEDVYKDFPQQAFGMMGLASDVPEPTHDEHETVQ